MAYPNIAAFRTFLDIGDDVGTDDGIQLILDSAVNFVESRTDRNFSGTVRQAIEKFQVNRLNEFNGRIVVRPRWFDIMSIVSIRDDDTTIEASQYYLFDDKIFIEPILEGDILTITYHFGTLQTPASISEAVLLKSKLLANESGNTALHSQKIISERTGDHQISFEEQTAGMTRQLDDILTRFMGRG